MRKHAKNKKEMRWYLAFATMASFLFMGSAYSEEVAANTATQSAPVAAAPVASPMQIAPYRTFISIQKYTIEQNGEVNQPVNNVKLEITFPNKSVVKLPENGDYWVIGNGQMQEINRTFELPFAYVQNDSFKFRIQMIRRGSKMLPCEFDVAQLSQFNRAYVCHTDLNWQNNQNIPPEKQDREGLQIRVFTDRQSQPKEIPQNAIAIR